AVVRTGLDHQVLDVHPEARELASRRSLALRDLVLVMRKNQVDATCVDVDRRFTEQAERHRGTLEMPAGAAGANPRVPGRLTIFRGFPQDEVAGVLLVVLVRIDAGARLD